MKATIAKNSRAIAAAVLSLGLVVGGTSYASAATPGSCVVTGSAFRLENWCNNAR